MNTPSPRLIPEIVANADEFRRIRHDLHVHPELAFEELRTADVVAEKLQQWQIPIHRGLGKTGVVGIVKAGQADRAIGLRTDMDALPIHEQNQFAHASKHPGKMHACGHDGHTAMLLAAAHYLAAHRNFDGTVYLIFQPAEEGAGGADAMIKDGLFELFPMQQVFGMHNWPGVAVGKIAVSEGPVMAAFSNFRIVVRGKGCHAAMPHLGLDPLPVAAQIVTALQTIVSRSVNPLDTAVVSVTTIHGGQAHNVIADDCEMNGTVRTFSADVMAMIERRMREMVGHICHAHGVEVDMEFCPGFPVTVNHRQPVAIARQVISALVGESNLLNQQPSMGAEDFAYMLQQVPGCYCHIGNGSSDHRLSGHGTGPCELHNASYDFNDELLTLGASYWVHLVEACLPA
jgi:hippurate hydrolase